MRKIINFTHATLDGYIDDPHLWSMSYADDEVQGHLLNMHLAADALLLGRVTYAGMAQAWPNYGGNPFGDHVNSITKYVVASQPVDTTLWNPTVVIPGATLINEITRLKETEGNDILIWGTGQLTRRCRTARRVPNLHLARHQRNRCTTVPPRQCRYSRTPRHQNIHQRRRHPHVPPTPNRNTDRHRITTLNNSRRAIPAPPGFGPSRVPSLTPTNLRA
jgi:dihydrofolate reductase